MFILYCLPSRIAIGLKGKVFFSKTRYILHYAILCNWGGGIILLLSAQIIWLRVEADFLVGFDPRTALA